MNYRPLGRTGLKVSPFCLGTMNFGPFTPEPDSFAIMDKAKELGLNFFDTADVYGRTRGEAVTEHIIGRWLAQGGGRRDYVVLATKVWGPMDLPDAPNPNLDRGLSARKIVMECENSLRRLQTDWIDLYQMHHIDRDCPFDEIWQAMEILVQQGKIRYAGSSNFAGWDIATAQAAAANRHFLGLVSEQCIYNLANRNVEMELLPACRHFGLGIIPWSPLWGGMLAGALEKKGVRRHEKNVEDRTEAHRPQLQKYEDLCRKLSQPPAKVALAWLLHQPIVTAPIIGPRTMEQLTTSVEALDLKLEESTLKQLDEIFPGPGEAPSAYAW
jgi:aryl-alcohol dehydrogenase-like predicted oxidoreductase